MNNDNTIFTTIKRDWVQGLIIFALLFFGILSLKAQDLNVANNEEEESFWIGYVYEGEDHFTGDHKSEIVEKEMFDESFGEGEGLISDVEHSLKNFSIRYEMAKTFLPGIYKIEIGSDDGIRLSIDGGKTYLINDVHRNGYKKSAIKVYLNGQYDLVMEYFNKNKHHRVSFDYTYLGDEESHHHERFGSHFLNKSHHHYAKGPFPHGHHGEESDVATLEKDR